jgi:hypothetical protein
VAQVASQQPAAVPMHCAVHAQAAGTALWDAAALAGAACVAQVASQQPAAVPMHCAEHAQAAGTALRDATALAGAACVVQAASRLQAAVVRPRAAPVLLVRTA